MKSPRVAKSSNIFAHCNNFLITILLTNIVTGGGNPIIMIVMIIIMIIIMIVIMISIMIITIIIIIILTSIVTGGATPLSRSFCLAASEKQSNRTVKSVATGRLPFPPLQSSLHFSIVEHFTIE